MTGDYAGFWSAEGEVAGVTWLAPDPVTDYA